MYQKCPICNGTGRDADYKYCTVCNGFKIIDEITGLPPVKPGVKKFESIQLSNLKNPE
jgi:DnaJ-class molecular chaperone